MSGILTEEEYLRNKVSSLQSEVERLMRSLNLEHSINEELKSENDKLKEGYYSEDAIARLKTEYFEKGVKSSVSSEGVNVPLVCSGICDVIDSHQKQPIERNVGMFLEIAKVLSTPLPPVVEEEKKEDPTKCRQCGNPHWMTDDHAGSPREELRLCTTCYNFLP